MIIEQLRNLLFLGLLMLILVVINRLYPNNPICPFDFLDRNERFESFFEWEKQFRTNNQDTNVSELVKARKQFYIDNNCKEATQKPIPRDYGIEQTGETTQQLLDIIENYNLK